MLTMIVYRQVPAAQRGFSLVELMISILIGAIVAVGAVTLIVAIDRSNSETIQSTRVHQELRALSSVIADNLKRSRRVHDAVFAVGQGASTNGSSDFVDLSQHSVNFSNAAPKWTDCIVAAYEDVPLDSGASNQSVKYIYQMFYRTSAGAIVFAQDATDTEYTSGGVPANPLSCGSAANTTTVVTLNSNILNVTDLKFNCVAMSGANVSTDVSNSASCSQINVSITAKLASAGTTTYWNNVSYTYVQQVFIRSGAIKTS